jgi:DNA helicase-2/ATP-dependent DNA helicase PcrA
MESELLTGLNSSQVEAVTSIEGPLLILAGPGSGKTRVITHRIAYMLQRGIEARSIVGLTFTNKAAGEMRSRLEKLVGVNQVWLGTFHSFCVRLLRRHARLVGLPENFSIYDTDDAQNALKAAVKEAKFELTHVSLGTLANRISYFKNRLVTPEILEAEVLRSDEFQVGQVYPFYQKELLRNAAVDFDDILMHAATLLRSHPDLRQELDERLRYVMVDEYQDTNLAQYVIVRHLCVDYPNLAATGDPDQSIYGWRGANIKNVTNFERDYPQLKIVRLEDNYRSTPEILSIADCLIKNNEYRKPKVLVPSRQSGNVTRLAIYPTARKEAEDIADQIMTLVGEGEHEFSDFGVLYRTNAHSRLLEQALVRRQIPFQLIGGFRFYLRKEIKDLVAYLLLLNNPEDNVAWLRAINTPSRGIGKQTIARLEVMARSAGTSMLEACRQAVASRALANRAHAALVSFLKIYDELVTLVHGPLLDLLQTTLEMTDYREHLRKQSRGGEEESDIFTNLDELLAEARELDSEADDDRSSLETFLEFAALQSDVDRLNSSQNVVTLMTLHAAKGLEFPCVYVIAVEENVLPHARSKDDPMSLEEERRLLFVGITRAMDRLQLSYARSRGFSGQGSGIPSSFLMELPRSEMQVSDHTDEYGDYSSASHSFADEDGYDDQGFREYDFGADDGSVDEDGQEFGRAPRGARAASEMFDDACQLPPEELRQRLNRKPNSAGKFKMMLASQMAKRTDGAGEGVGFPEGSLVSHEKFGQGRVIAASGHGSKRAVTINFFSDGSRRTFRVQHVELKLLQLD